MNKLFGTFIILIILSIGISSNALSSNGPAKNRCCIFYGEIETKGCVDLGTRYFIYNINNKRSMEIKNAYFKNVFNGMPVPTRDLKHFVFFTKKGQNQYLNVLDLDKRKIEKKVKIPLPSGELAVSNNMQYMAFYRNLDMYEDDNREIYFYSYKSNKLTRITNNNIPDYNPVFSPDGNFILYLSKPNLHSTILKKYHIAKATTESVKNFSGTGYDLNQWAENGLVLIINQNKNGTPFWLDLKTGQTKDINLDRIYDIKASPDGKRLMYHQARKDDESEWDLFVSDANGKNSKMISKPDNVDIFGVEWVLSR